MEALQFESIATWGWYALSNAQERRVWGHIDKAAFSTGDKWVACPRLPDGSIIGTEYHWVDTREEAIAWLVCWRLMNGRNEDGTAIQT